MRLKIHQKETIREEEPSCSCKRKQNVNDYLNDQNVKEYVNDQSVREYVNDQNVKEYVNEQVNEDVNVHVNEQVKGKVYVNNAKPLYVTGKSRRVVVPASEPIVVKPAPVVIRQKGDVEVRPIHITKQPPPLIVTKKIVKLHQPIVKKYYVEKYRKHEEGCPEHIISQKVSKKTCNCPISEHVVSSKYNWVRDDSAPLIEKENVDNKYSQSIKVLSGDDEEVDTEFDFDES